MLVLEMSANFSRLVALALVIVVVLGLVVPSWALPPPGVVSLSPQTIVVTVSSNFDLTINKDTYTVSMKAFHLAISFDPALMEYVSSKSSLPNDWNFTVTPDQSELIVEGDKGTSELYLIGVGTLATLTFHCLAHGTSTVGFITNTFWVTIDDLKDAFTETDGAEVTQGYFAAVGNFTALPTGNMTMVIGDLALNPHGSKPSGVSYQQGRDTTPLGFVSGMLTNPQPSVFDTNSTWINATSGRPFASILPELIFSIGGPGINSVTYYYESTAVVADMAPVKFGYNSTHFYWMFTSNGTKVPGSEILQSSTAVPPGTSDVFVIQILHDADNRTVVLMYGTRYTGTWAAAWWFKFVVYPNIASYTDAYYIVRWTDAASGAGSDYTPDLGDTYTILAQGAP